MVYFCDQNLKIVYLGKLPYKFCSRILDVIFKLGLAKVNVVSECFLNLCVPVKSQLSLGQKFIFSRIVCIPIKKKKLGFKAIINTGLKVCKINYLTIRKALDPQKRDMSHHLIKLTNDGESFCHVSLVNVDNDKSELSFGFKLICNLGPTIIFFF